MNLPSYNKFPVQDKVDNDVDSEPEGDDDDGFNANEPTGDVSAGRANESIGEGEGEGDDEDVSGDADELSIDAVSNRGGGRGDSSKRLKVLGVVIGAVCAACLLCVVLPTVCFLARKRNRVEENASVAAAEEAQGAAADADDSDDDAIKREVGETIVLTEGDYSSARDSDGGSDSASRLECECTNVVAWMIRFLLFSVLTLPFIL